MPVMSSWTDHETMPVAAAVAADAWTVYALEYVASEVDAAWEGSELPHPNALAPNDDTKAPRHTDLRTVRISLVVVTEHGSAGARDSPRKPVQRLAFLSKMGTGVCAMTLLRRRAARVERRESLPSRRLVMQPA